MNSTQFIRNLKENRLRIFTAKGAMTLTNAGPAATVQLLRRLSEEKIVIRLKRGVWANLLAPALRLEEAVPFLTAPWPSYVSLYSALSEQGLIAEVPSILYAVTSGRSMRLKTALGDLSIHHLPAAAMYGYETRIFGEGSFPLATPEKAYLDTVYLASIPRSPIRTPVFRHRPRFDQKRLRNFLKKWPGLKKLIGAPQGRADSPRMSRP